MNTTIKTCITAQRFAEVKTQCRHIHVYIYISHKTSKPDTSKHQWSEHFNDTALIQTKWENFINGDKRNPTMTGIPFNKWKEIHAENIHMMPLCFRTAGVSKLPYRGKKKKSFEILHKL